MDNDALTLELMDADSDGDLDEDILELTLRETDALTEEISKTTFQ